MYVTKWRQRIPYSVLNIYVYILNICIKARMFLCQDCILNFCSKKCLLFLRPLKWYTYSNILPFKMWIYNCNKNCISRFKLDWDCRTSALDEIRASAVIERNIKIQLNISRSVGCHRGGLSVIPATRKPATRISARLPARESDAESAATATARR